MFAIPLAALLTFLSLLHAYWALGGRWGIGNTIPSINGRPAFEPSPWATWIVSGLLALAVVIVAGKAGWIPRNPRVFGLNLWALGVWGLALVFLLRAIGDCRLFGAFKTVTGTRFADWDTRLYTPLCLALALLAASLAATSND